MVRGAWYVCPFITHEATSLIYPKFWLGTSLGNVRSLSSVWKFRSLGKAGFQKLILSKISIWNQGTNARKVISETYAFLYWSVLSLGRNVNTRRLTKPDMGSIFHIKNQWNMLVIGNYYVNYQNYQNLMLLTSSDTKRTLMHLFLFTNSAQGELVSICTQSIRDRN